MSSILDKLLKGQKVEWKKLEDVVLDKFWIMPATPNFDERGEIPYITSKNIKGGNIDFNKSKLINRSDFLEISRNRPILKDDILISMIGTIGEVARVKQSDLDFYGQNMYLIRLNQDIIDIFFFLHYFDSPFMKNYFFSIKNNSGQGYLKSNHIEKIQIPIPSLSIQREIAKTLDTFTALTAKLTAELTMREKQYHYYRDKLLTFSDDVDWKTLSDIAEYSNTRIKFDELNEENYIGVDNLLQNRAGKVNSNYLPTVGNLTAYFQNDILIGNIRPYLKKIWHADNQGGASGDVLVIHPTDDKVNPRYLYQILADDKFFNYNMQNAKGAKMPRGSKDAILKYNIPIPSLEKQQYIVNILDKFETLTNSITEGLPKEIALRQQQYEYYREQLLDFPK